MSSEGPDRPSDAGPKGKQGEPSEEELRAAYEAELERITSTDVMLQAAVSLLNLGALRLGANARGAGGAGDVPAGGPRDLEQVRDAIDGVRALLGVLERRISNELGPLRDALSQLQIAYAREAQTGAGATDAAASGAGAQPAGGPAGGQAQGPGGGEKDQQDAKRPAEHPGPAEASGKLWVPGR